MGSVIVAIICNLVALLVIICGLINGARNSWKVSLIRFLLVIAGGVGIFFLNPIVTEAVGKIMLSKAENITVAQFLMGDVARGIDGIGMSLASFNSIFFTLLVLVWYGIVSIVCKIVRHALIKSYRHDKANKAKAKRARSINPKAEKKAKKARWKALQKEYKDNNKKFKKFISCILSFITAVVLSVIILMPFDYIGEDINRRADGKKAYLEKGYYYTLNGVIDEKIDFKVFDWLVDAEETSNLS